jgi:hypothetical protein
MIYKEFKKGLNPTYEIVEVKCLRSKKSFQEPKLSFKVIIFKRCHDIQHDDTQSNDTQHNRVNCDTEHERQSAKSLNAVVLSVTYPYCYAECNYAKRHIMLLLCLMSLF